MAKLQPIRGTHDLLFDDARKHAHVMDVFRTLAERYGYGRIDTPIIEFTEVFKRTLGETTDVVTKEMYTFEDRGGDSITLRPELTAGVARAFISGGLAQNLPLKLYSWGAMFRRERPQKGRQRQFHQLDIEVLGVDGPQADIEVIALGAHLLDELGLADRVTLELNTLGDRESRKDYRDVLAGYLADHRDELSDEGKHRLEHNPLRILDTKDKGDRAVIKDAPRMSEHLNAESAEFFAEVCAGLDRLGINYVLNEKLVRGFDYYTHTAFEFITEHLGAQGTVIGGGRYDHLIETMGGPATPGIGWAAGIERLAMLAEEAPAAARPIAVIPVGGEAQEAAMSLTNTLRRHGLTADQGFRGNLKKRMDRANKAGARFAVLIGGDELERGVATVRDLDSGEQHEVAMDEVAAHLSAKR